jgi:transcriptional regulator with PAS, ATPase and Fis domain
MKRCLVVSFGVSTGELFIDQLSSVVGEDVEFELLLLRNMDSKSKEEIDAYDIVFFSGEATYRQFFESLPVAAPHSIAGRIINHNNIEQIISLPEGTDVLLINDQKESVDETIEQLNDLGLNHIKYHPYYPGIKKYMACRVGITPGEAHLMPDCVQELVDIGVRLLDLKTLYEFQNILGIVQVLNQGLIFSYIKDIIKITKSIDKSRRAEKESRQVMEVIFNNVDKGIAYMDVGRKIVKINSKFQSIVGKNRRDILNKTLSQIISDVDIDELIEESRIISILNIDYVVDGVQIGENDNLSYLLMVYPIDRIANLKKKKMSTASYNVLTKLQTLDDYHTVNAEMKKVLSNAERFAKTDATIAIHGENGTGKEIIAQGIHASSYRQSKPFVPVNIAAMNQNLLESELFGYESGSFTGASKEGKTGLFEVAQGGTLFIDEIGDAPHYIQVKLLRVLQEKKIRRVGGVEEIPVDVRIITATNKNLLDLVDQGKFREDLYFRLNIIPLRTIPLRMRPMDIEHLLKRFVSIYFNKDEGDLEHYLKKDTLDFLNGYRWRGNVRELINLVEYLSYIYDGRPFEIGDLPAYLLEQTRETKRLSNEELWLLREIQQSPGKGRVTLHKKAVEGKMDLGEGQIRRVISSLQKEGLVESNRTGRGLVISDYGRQILQNSR